MFNHILRQVFLRKYARLQQASGNPFAVQQRLWERLMQKARYTEWGQRYRFGALTSPEAFRQALPLSEYEALRPDVTRMMQGTPNVLWAGRPQWFSKSSGTTGGKSKFIPVSPDNLIGCHLKGTWDTMGIFYHHRPDARQFSGKTMLMGGSWQPYEGNPDTRIGDISAIMIQRMPWVARPFFIPDRSTALLADWETKLERLAQAGARERDVVTIGGVPTWTVVLFRRILEITGKQNMLEVWPNFQLYTHGGVSFVPYRQQFQEFFPSESVDYQEIYNASEGFFAIQDQLYEPESGMLLLLDNGVYYEFLPMSEWDKPQPKALGLHEVEMGKQYALVISTNAGLWRYLPGDTVVFTSLKPFRIKISGRTKQFINAFGEEVIVENTDQAIAMTCQETHAAVAEYTVAPVYFEREGKGRHQWLVEFEKMPADTLAFAALLDRNLQKLNSDYEAKRYGDLALTSLELQVLPQGTFLEWLKTKGRLGGQHKVPRLANQRDTIEDILAFVAHSKS
ncbi:MAG: GH3 auxin-responsive promoter family protein [Saprospiraceae bacterium]